MRILFISLFALLPGSCQQQNPQSAAHKESTGKEAQQTHSIKKNYYAHGILMPEIPVKEDAMHGMAIDSSLSDKGIR